MPRSPKYSIDEHFFENPEKWTEKQAYWLGWLYSDGSITDKCLSIKLQEKDKSVLEKLKKMVGYDGPLTFLRRAPSSVMGFPTKQHQHRWCLSICTKELREQLKELGIDGSKNPKALIKHLKPKLHRHFIRGLWEGDGTFCFTKWSRLETNLLADQSMLKWVQDKLGKVGLSSSLRETGFSNGVKIIRLCGNNKGITLFNYLYSGCRYYLPRKIESFVRLYRYKQSKSFARKTDRKGLGVFKENIERFL